LWETDAVEGAGPRGEKKKDGRDHGGESLGRGWTEVNIVRFLMRRRILETQKKTTKKGEVVGVKTQK